MVINNNEETETVNEFKYKREVIIVFCTLLTVASIIIVSASGYSHSNSNSDNNSSDKNIVQDTDNSSIDDHDADDNDSASVFYSNVQSTDIPDTDVENEENKDNEDTTDETVVNSEDEQIADSDKSNDSTIVNDDSTAKSDIQNASSSSATSSKKVESSSNSAKSSTSSALSDSSDKNTTDSTSSKTASTASSKTASTASSKTASTASSKTASTASSKTASTASSKNSSDKLVNPADYESKTTIKVLDTSAFDLSSRSSEFKNICKNCSRAVYAYADPKENSDSSFNSSKNGSKSFAACILGYNNTSEKEFLNAKIAVSNMLYKLYATNNSWFKKITGSYGVYIILENSSSVNGYASIKFGNPTDGFGVRIASDKLSNSYNKRLVYHELGYAVWDCGAYQDSFYFGIDSNTGKNYGSGNFTELYTKLFNDSLSKNSLYKQTSRVYENFANCTASFFDSSWRSSLKKEDPIVYNILKQIYYEL